MNDARRLLVASALAFVAGCQNYNFNPVGKCVIQPGSAQIQLSSIATADVLFVVDDSGSMASEQQRLANNFGAFITSLATTQAQRKASGLDPLEFHIAVTTSSIFEAYQAQPNGTPICGTPTANVCTIGQPVYGWKPAYTESCDQAGAGCSDIIDIYYAACAPQNWGVGSANAPYPAGNFVASGSNPSVLHFTKDLAWETWDPNNPQNADPKLTALINQFKANIAVGACGSGMEQHLQAGRLAVEKALAGKQVDSTGAKVDWPHAGAKMVVVWVGDEDDCSNPKDATRSIQFLPRTSTVDPNPPGNDACIADEQKAPADRKMFAVQDFATYFTTLDRPFSAAFIYSSDPASCQPDSSGNIVCNTALCTCTCPTDCTTCTAAAVGATPGRCQYDSQCSGKSTGTRFHDLSAAFRQSGISTLDGSVCDWDFAKTLQGIAELVKPPAGLTLPTQPAASEVALLKIQSASGGTSRLCTGPGAGLDWEFVDCKTGVAAPAGVTTTCIAINHSTGHCEANPGETYIAQYLGIVPPPDATRTKNPAGGCAVASDCSDVLGGDPTQWLCEGASAQTRGTCLCASGG